MRTILSALRRVTFDQAKRAVQQTGLPIGHSLRSWLLQPSLLGGLLLLVPPCLAAQSTPPTAGPSLQPRSGQVERPRIRTADRNFWLWTGLTVGLTIADIEMTQHCLHKHRCREGNPLLTGSRPRAYAIGLGTAAGFSYLGYRLKKKQQQGQRRPLPWWYPQLALSAGHGAGVAFGFRFAW